MPAARSARSSTIPTSCGAVAGMVCGADCIDDMDGLNALLAVLSTPSSAPVLAATRLPKSWLSRSNQSWKTPEKRGNLNHSGTAGQARSSTMPISANHNQKVNQTLPGRSTVDPG
jgi:hypothetical protein